MSDGNKKFILKLREKTIDMDNEKTILIKEEERSEMCAEPATMFLEDRFGVSWSTDCTNKDPTLNLGWDETENNNSVNALVNSILEAEREPCPSPLQAAKMELLVENPSEIHWRTDFIKEDPELNMDADETEITVVSSRRYESDGTRLIQVIGESCGNSLEESVNEDVVHNELKVDTKESMHFTIFNTHTQRWTSEDISLDNNLKCSLRGQELHKFSCSSCLQNFYSKYRLIKHVFTHIEGMQPPMYVCKSCGEVFHSNVSLKKHLERVECDRATKNNKCDVCGMSFPHVHYLKSHVLTHAGVRPHKCNTCSKSFTELGSLKRHVLIHSRMRLHKCNTCGKSYTRLDNLKTHALIHTGIRPHKCNTCGKCFTEEGNLKRHVLIHTGMRPHNCNTCGKSFTESGTLKKHALIHTGMRPHNCNTCGKSFRELGTLKKHALIHTGMKPHNCNTCGKSFTELGSLKKHALIHTGTKPHKCNTCGKSFTQLCHLKRHALIHTGMRPRKCNT